MIEHPAMIPNIYEDPNKCKGCKFQKRMLAGKTCPAPQTDKAHFKLSGGRIKKVLICYGGRFYQIKKVDKNKKKG